MLGKTLNFCPKIFGLNTNLGEELMLLDVSWGKSSIEVINDGYGNALKGHGASASLLLLP